MARDYLLEVTAPGDVCPELITVKEFGGHTSYVRNGERIFTFHTEWGFKKFQMVGHLPKYKRSQNVGK